MGDDRYDLLCLDAPRAESIREGLLDEETAYGAAGRARALSDPTRLTLAAPAEGGELCVCDLAWISGRSQGLVYHRPPAGVRPGQDGQKTDGRGRGAQGRGGLRAWRDGQSGLGTVRYT